MRPLDHLRDAALADVLEDRLHLLGRGRLLGDIELERVAARLARRVARLVLGGGRLRVGRDLPQQVGDAGRGRGVGLVKDRDDVERLALRLGVSGGWAAFRARGPDSRSGTF